MGNFNFYATICCAISIFCGLIALIVVICRSQITHRIICAIEAFVLIVVVLFLACGTRSTVMELAMPKKSDQQILAADKTSAMQEAYSKLYDDLSRWFVMFAVLGSFFGLVIPICSYLLQIKAVNRREDEFDTRLKDEALRHKTAIDKAEDDITEAKTHLDSALNDMDTMKFEMEKIKDEACEAKNDAALKYKSFSDRVASLWRAQTIMAYERVEDAIRDFANDDWKYDRGTLRELLRSLMLCLKFLESTKSEKFIKGKIEDIAGLVDAFAQKTVDCDAEMWTRGFKRQTSVTRIVIEPYCADCLESLNKIRAVLNKFGITVLD